MKDCLLFVIFADSFPFGHALPTMAGSSGKYVKTKSSNPFLDDDDLEDVDDETFLQKSPNKSILNSGGLNLGGASSRYKYSNLSSERSAPAADSAGMTASPSSDSIEDRRQRLLLEKQRVEQRTLESSNRSIGVLFETEQVGSAAAEELLRQREQLERTGSRLDEMNNSLRSSEKHIQNIKVLAKPFDTVLSRLIAVLLFFFSERLQQHQKLLQQAE